jgi:hypothetical protein
MILSRERCRQFNYYRNSGRSATPHDRRARSAFPDLGRQIEESMAVAIDGAIYQDAYLAPLNPDSDRST